MLSICTSWLEALNSSMTDTMSSAMYEPQMYMSVRGRATAALPALCPSAAGDDIVEESFIRRCYD